MLSDQNKPKEQLRGRQGLYSVTDKSALSIRQTQKLIDSLDNIYGFDLAQIILLISKNKVSGYLNIISEKNEIYGVSFSDGNIVQIDNQDEKTFIGQLLISDGFITESDLKLCLKKTDARVGEELVDSGKVTKEQLISVLLKQTILRLTQLINGKSIQISFIHTDVQNSDICITYSQLVDLSFDWVFSCVTEQWLNMHYFEYKNNELKLATVKIKNEYPTIYQKLVEVVGKDFIPIFEAKKQIRLIETEIAPQILFRLIHQLILVDCVFIVSQIKDLLQENDISNFLNKFKKSTPQEKLSSLAIFTKCAPNETELIYEKFMERIKNLNIDVDLKNNTLKALMGFLLNPEQIKLALETNTNSDTEVIAIKNQAKDLILNKKYFLAFTLLKKLDDSQMKSSKIELYALWCLIGHAIDSNVKIDPTALKIRLSKIRPEDRFEAEYFYVLSLYHKYLKMPTESQHYYLKSCAMNPIFKDFKLQDDNLITKIKSIFKFAIIFSILTLAQKTYSNTDTSPIRFTNQYYQYNVTNKKIEIAGLVIELNDLNKTISDLDMKPDKKCFVLKTESSQLKICPTTDLVLDGQEPQVMIANSIVENTGSVILQDLVNYIDLQVLINNSVALEFKSRRRPIAPYIVQKDAGSDTAFFTFLDLNNRKNIWGMKLNTQVLTFKLESITEPYHVFQDYIYLSDNPEADEIDFTMKLPREIQFSYNRLGVNLLAGFSSFTTITSTFKSTLNSAVGKGIKFLYERNLDETTSLYTNLILYSAKISDELNSVVINNKNFNLIDFNVGYKVYYDLNWALNYEFNFRNHFSTKETFLGSNQFDIDPSNSISLGLTPEYTFLESRRWNFVSEGSLGMIFPHKTSYAQSQIGYLWGLGLKSTYKLKASRIYAGLNYEDRTFNSSEAKFKNRDMIYAVGFYYLY